MIYLISWPGPGDGGANVTFIFGFETVFFGLKTVMFGFEIVIFGFETVILGYEIDIFGFEIVIVEFKTVMFGFQIVIFEIPYSCLKIIYEMVDPHALLSIDFASNRS